MTKYVKIPGFNMGKVRDVTSKQYLTDAYKRLTNAGFALKLTPTKSVLADGHAVSGYFDEDNKEIVLGTGGRVATWLPALVHEVCHFDQWREGCAVWRDFTYPTGGDCGVIWDAWISSKSKRYTPAVICDMLRRVRNCEIDCERRTLRVIADLMLPVDAAAYAQRANSYIYFYNYATIRKQWWVRGKAPYASPQICAMMPHVILEDNSAYDTISPELVLMYDKYCTTNGLPGIR